MNKIALLTLNGSRNYGNKLQHYGLQNYLLNNFECSIETICCYEKKKVYSICRKIFGIILKKRNRSFYCFDKKIKYSHSYIYNNQIKNIKEYNTYVIGSDQVWNVSYPVFTKKYVLEGIKDVNKVSYASSFGISNLPKEYHQLFRNCLKDFKSISVREDRGKEIIEELTGRKDVEVLVDPTMLLTSEEWDKVSNRPKQLENIKEEKYILNYFLGELSESRKKEIERLAKENNCHIINILDKNDPFYVSGPSEFLYLEKHSFLICTDSFHSSVFAILYNRPFVIFEREDKEEKMNSRIDTLLSKFKLKNRRYNGSSITKENLEHDYTEAYKILEEERKKSKAFLEKALDIKE